MGGSRGAWAVVLVVVLACVPGGWEVSGGAVTVTPADVASAVLVAVALARLAAGGRRLPRAALLLLPLVAAATAATWAAPDPLAALPGLLRFTQVFVLVPLAVVVLLPERRDVRPVAGAVVAAALVQGAIGCVQAASGSGASYAGEHVRAVGTFGAGDVMAMATLVSYGLVIALAVGLTARGLARAAALVTAAVLAVPLALSLSRGAWLAMLCAAAAMLAGRAAISRRRGAAPAVASLLAGACGLVVLTGASGAAARPAEPEADVIAARLSSITSSFSQPDRSVGDRYSLWQTALNMWRDRPLLGAGPKGFAAGRDAYAPLDLSSGSDTDDPVSGYRRQPLLSPHNMYLLVLSEQGVLGLAAFALLLAGLAVWSLRRLARARRPSGRAAGLAAVGVLAWQIADFAYADVGGAVSLVMSVMLGLTLWWATGAAAERGPGR
ncbi:O-antigen ligase [Thermocatellispora tengchongensis]|uniref:O-antigen ligase n=1 Tax=Thermocatellispora tengchongensis TaxID=1073253 RepID=A0A840P306_9ACTN|nr:O-antigen ligase family protein [Thermocatellispora tengchongensis]MBB5133369.1 O-antigen ligase [Thermocatellispora tengchongensis]